VDCTDNWEEKIEHEHEQEHEHEERKEFLISAISA
jgi:hypothetical protein